MSAIDTKIQSLDEKKQINDKTLELAAPNDIGLLANHKENLNLNKTKVKISTLQWTKNSHGQSYGLLKSVQSEKELKGMLKKLEGLQKTVNNFKETMSQKNFIKKRNI